MEKLIVKKKNGILEYEDIEGYETRNSSTFKCIQEADKIYNWKDFEITIYTGDGDRYDDCNEYTYSKKTMFRLVPDFNFDAWPQVGITDYITTVKEIEEVGKTPAKIFKVGWIGNTETNIMRKKLLKYGRINPTILDILDMKWIRSHNGLKATTYMSMPDLVKTYEFLIDIEGFGYSGRLKHLLWSQRPLLLVERPYKEFFFKYLTKWEHYIPVKRDLSDLIIKVVWCMKNHEKAKIIASNALEFAKKHLTREACYSEWNDIITQL